jgi:hypothetical protein
MKLFLRGATACSFKATVMGGNPARYYGKLERRR